MALCLMTLSLVPVLPKWDTPHVGFEFNRVND
jgi:hypothetical protein